jgi:hypothetical protein
MADQWPRFYAHQGSQSPSVLRDFLDQYRRTTGDPLGATVFLSRYVPSTSRDTIASFQMSAGSVIGDPESHRLELPYSERGRGRKELSYLQESDPIANRSRFVDEVLRAQTDAGGTLLVSPWLTHGLDPGTKHLRATLRFAEAAAESPMSHGRALVFGFAVTQRVLSDEDLRGDLLDQLVELPTGDIYLRVRVTAPSSYQQYADLETLKGLRIAVEQLANNGRSAMLPLSGLAGCLFLPFGASAFGTGINASLQHFSEPTDGFAQQPLDWYYLPQFLGFVLRQEMRLISQLPEYRHCDCPYCERLSFGRGEWNKIDAGLHYLWSAARLAADVTASGTPQAEVLRERLGDARGFWSIVQRSSVPLDRRSEPLHLAVWSEVVA